MDMEWIAEFSVGISGMDEQHRRFFSIIGGLRKGSSYKNEQKALADSFRDLLSYANTHFADEEQLMREHDYPELSRHELEHREFIESVTKFKDDFEAGAAPKPLILGSFMYNWLKDHIARSDKHYGRYLNSRGIK